MKIILAGMLLLAVCGCASGSLLTVKIGEPIYYRSEKGDRFIARYGQLSDGSLSFVKVKMPDGREYTLPSAMSASGARYTDDRELVWWEHQGTVRLDIRRADGEWETGYLQLREDRNY
ncbi:MAG: MliC family protein [Thermodesulfobacteriota bacterium]